MTEAPAHARLIGVSLKMYFDHVQTMRWCTDVADVAAGHEAVTSGAVELIVIPSFPELAAAVDIFGGTPVTVGAQDLFWEDAGAFTGEVSGRQLVQVGCTHVEIGHAERRRLFHESDEVLQAKVGAAVRNALTPILCVGEPEPIGIDAATEVCVGQLEAMTRSAIDNAPNGAVIRTVVAYEPEWAIGAQQPASIDHIRGVCSAIKRWLDTHPALRGSQVIYGGSAGPGLVSALDDAVDGVFLGRFAHEPAAVAGILDESLLLHDRTDA